MLLLLPYVSYESMIRPKLKPLQIKNHRLNKGNHILYVYCTFACFAFLPLEKVIQPNNCKCMKLTSLSQQKNVLFTGSVEV